MPAYWLFKSEPNTWSWDQHVAAGTAEWDGVRNHQAKNHMIAMKRGDQGMFYHSGKDKQVVGVVRVAKTYYPDPTDKTGKFGMVDLEVVRTLKSPVTLAQIKAEPRLSDMVLVRNTRLSVQPVEPAEWKIVLAMAK
ncbi:MAG: ubiquinol-cytochrome C reductase [Phycisphaeraceae bacterium]|nr:ubiquinol-cytochrome C reductase [Phycisphaeraceae bacterium]